MSRQTAQTFHPIGMVEFECLVSDDLPGATRDRLYPQTHQSKHTVQRLTQIFEAPEY